MTTLATARLDSLGDRFKSGFRLHPAGVALVTCITQAGPVGLTASSVASVSVTPPMLSFSVSRASTSGAALVSASRLNVILLGAEDAGRASDFATQGAARFVSDQGWVAGAGELPVLRSAPVVMSGRPSRVVPAGESWLVLVDVASVELGPARRPLVYYDRGYWSLTAGRPL
jgi:flavin reductase (DIM6/NTAB) family NADH-FMN oxidoreductase RutF